MVRKKHYEIRERGINSFDVQPSKLKLIQTKTKDRLKIAT